MYRRVRPDMSLREFVRFPHPETLLDAIGHWRLFVESWLAREGTLAFRFEDYKADPAGTLSRIVRALGLQETKEAIARAASESSFAKARAAEERYRSAHPRDAELAMRAGEVGEWKRSPELLELAREIEGRAGPIMARLGYEPHGPSEPRHSLEGVSHLRFLSVFQERDLPPGLRETAAAADPMACPLLRDTLGLASTLDADAIRRARLQVHEARALLESVEEYAARWREHQARRIHAARADFADGGDYHLSRVRELMASRRPARSRTPDPPQDEAPPSSGSRLASPTVGTNGGKRMRRSPRSAR
jgi:hypothetical protein